jgi:hypothetical protein
VSRGSPSPSGTIDGDRALSGQQFNQEAAMTDFRDPSYRDPSAPDYRRPDVGTGAWSNATWGWIAGICVVVLVLIFAFGSGSDSTRTTTDGANPPTTTGQRPMPAPPAGGPRNEAPTMNRPLPAPAGPTAPPLETR